MGDDIKIKLRAQELCREMVPANLLEVPYRNECIISKLMKEFNIERKFAEECFYNNKEF